MTSALVSVVKNWPNQSPEPTSGSVTPRASALFAQKLLSHRTQLLVDDNGIWNATWGVGTVRWTQVKQVFVLSSGNRDLLCLRLRDPEEVYCRLDTVNRKILEGLRTAGFGDLSLDTATFGDQTQPIIAFAEKKIDELRSRPNQPVQPTPGSVTPRASHSHFEMKPRNTNRHAARGAPAPVVADL
jgi:hypothetical protein